MKIACDVPVFTGDFASQPLVFAHLLDWAEGKGLNPDFDFVEVIKERAETRLSAMFDLHDVDAIRARAGDTIVLVMPGADFPLTETEHLAFVGTYQAKITRALIGETE